MSLPRKTAENRTLREKTGQHKTDPVGPVRSLRQPNAPSGSRHLAPKGGSRSRLSHVGSHGFAECLHPVGQDDGHIFDDTAIAVHGD